MSEKATQNKTPAAELTRRGLLRALATGAAAAGAVAIAGRTSDADEIEIRDLGAGGEPKTTICHKPGTPAEKTMEVPDSAVADHLDHGDLLGDCNFFPPPAVRVA